MNDGTSDEKILGKFDSYEQLEKSYKELESKLGERKVEKTPESKDNSAILESLDAVRAELAEYKKEREEAKAKANHPLNNKEFKKQLAEGLATLPQEKVAEINKRIEKGEVNETELKIYASLADKPKESNDQLSAEKQKGGTYDDLEKELHEIINDPKAAWMDTRHPMHAKVVERKAFIERKLGVR